MIIDLDLGQKTIFRDKLHPVSAPVDTGKSIFCF